MAVASGLLHILSFSYYIGKFTPSSSRNMVPNPIWRHHCPNDDQSPRLSDLPWSQEHKFFNSSTKFTANFRQAL